MGYINSVDEIDEAMISEGIDEILNSDDEVAIAEYKLKLEFAKEQKKMNSLAAMGYGYYLDNCSDKVNIDTTYYCKHCLQPECCKRLAKLNNNFKIGDDIWEIIMKQN